MTFLSRLKYLLGALLVVAAVAALFLNLNDRISSVQGVSATIQSRAYTVGTSYSGVVVKESVRVGDTVEKGQPLFVVKSNDLARDIANDVITPARSPYDIRDGNKLVVRATSPGKVVAVNYIKGAFVPTDATLARIQQQGTSYVDADFRLSPTEYALMRRARTVTVTLPNQRKIEASVTRVQVRTSGRQAETSLRARAPQLTNHGLFSTGTPVDVQVRLRNDGLAHSVKSAVEGLLTPGGQR